VSPRARPTGLALVWIDRYTASSVGGCTAELHHERRRMSLTVELGNMKVGFFIVGGVYALVFLILILISKKMLLPSLRNMIIKKIYEQD
jgi:hypothetical protein